jgi:addiction module HigA family antidote
MPHTDLANHPMLAAPAPVHPGEYIREDVLPALQISIEAAAERSGIERSHFEQLIYEHVPVTAEMAFGLSRLAGNGPWLWINLQVAYDMWHAFQKLRTEQMQANSAA